LARHRRTQGEGGAARAIFGVAPLAAPYFAGLLGGWPFSRMNSDAVMKAMAIVVFIFRFP
jgi:hypothetical protein